MMTNSTRPVGGNRNTQLEQAAALKALIGSASLALTLAGWAFLSHQQAALNDASPASSPGPAEQAGGAIEPSVIAEAPPPGTPDPLPTLAPLYRPALVEVDRPARSAGAAQVAPPQVAAPQAVAPQPPLRVVSAPRQPVAVTRSSR